MTRPIIVFDLDGTLIDTAPDLLDSLNHVITVEGLDPVSTADLRSHVGHGARAMLRRAYTAQERALPDARLEYLVAVFIEHYTANMPGRSRPFDGAVACMDRFEAAGFVLAVCTNKFEAMSRQLLEALGIGERFAAVCGANTFPVRKPEPGHLTGTIDRAGGDRNRAVMIGDSDTDINTAKAAGIPVVAVDFGYSPQPVDTFAPDRIISHFDALTPLMANELIGARTRP
ncbi:MAG: phosphoglycolate phosphatase [Roseitalea sp.]|nr:phosphoglycolate phosphatase [Roseitalea sp.]MBO6950503.1 phosphoglycolate phosphatase [Rhizobiaceae bacterium]MBO6591510.1 phosphoglycolate phosphatase [Roseitalea sp.]MBO6599365.1 phosphoglycolate phosphatase [Roseitalea sp.]MBO6612146.1 phosphoglycolate phosphatase [Roseitalea sp.]